MNVDLYIAASLEGFIADRRGGVDWVCNDALLEHTVRQYGVACMGSVTYAEYGGPPFEGVQYIILTRRPPKKAKAAAVHFVSSVEAAMAKARELGFQRLIVIGGAKTNQSFMQAGVVSKVFVDIHPLLLGEGLQMFGDYKAKFDFKMVKNNWHAEGFMHAEYAIGQAHKAFAAVIIRDQDGRYFVHRRRADKKYFPGRWELGVGGKIGDTEPPQEAAQRELLKSTGLKTSVRPCFHFEYTGKTIKRTVYVFETFVKKPKNYSNTVEWDRVAWRDAEQVNELASESKLCPDAQEIYQRYRSALNV